VHVHANQGEVIRSNLFVINCIVTHKISSQTSYKVYT